MSTKPFHGESGKYIPIYINALDKYFSEDEREILDKRMSKEEISHIIRMYLSKSMNPDVKYTYIERPDDIITCQLSGDVIISHNTLQQIFDKEIIGIKEIAAIQQTNKWSCGRACYNSLLMTLEHKIDGYKAAQKATGYREIVVGNQSLIGGVSNMRLLTQGLNKRLTEYTADFRIGITQEELEGQCALGLPTMVSYIATNKIGGNLPHYSIVIGHDDSSFFLYNPYDNKLQSLDKSKFMKRLNVDKEYCTTFLLQVMRKLGWQSGSGIVISKNK